MHKVTVRVPASTSNLGPGFDCLGVALRIYNFVTVSRQAGEERLPAMVDEAARLFFKGSGLRRFRFACIVRGDVPPCRGLGSSVTVRLGTLHGLNELCRRPLDKLSIFQICAGLERHPDNAAPASFGGFTIARAGSVQRFNVSPRLFLVLLVPDLEVSTSAARKALPARISHTAAVTSCGNACAITAAFAAKKYEHLRGAFDDHLHQPFRLELNPRLRQVIAAAEKAGALGGFLSGSGSTIAAVTLQDPDGVAAAMRRAAKSSAARTVITTADNRGVQLNGR